MMETPKQSVLFVCLGNICRSPMAKWILLDMTASRGMSSSIEVDSCGTGGWHAGEPADPRSAACAARHGLQTDHTARQFSAQRDSQFDFILVMDRNNLRDVIAMGAPTQKVHLLRSFDPLLADAHEREMEVPDPYYGGEQGFEQMHQMIRRACEGLLNKINNP